MWIAKDNLLKISKVIEKIVNGKEADTLIDEIIKNSSNSNIIEIVNRLEHVINKFKNIENLLEKISSGDYRVGIDSYSGGETLAIALTNVIERVRDIDGLIEAISFGDFSKKINQKSENDKVANSINRIVDRFRDIVTQLNYIADGDYEKSITPLHSGDTLGIALSKMTINLKNLKIESDKRDWIKSNINRLSENLSGNKAQQIVSSEAISFISRAISGGFGAVYLNNGDKFFLVASFAYTERDISKNMFKLGEGIIGQVALEKNSILLKNLTRDDLVITSGLISQPPINSYTIPLIYEDFLYGVIEVASFEEFDKYKLEFLNESAKVLASYLFASKQREEAKVLLQLSEDANAKLQTQSEEVMQLNSQLEEQQQQLQQQSEELQQTNAQLEELQQQLQQQLEELQINNDELVKSRYEINKRNRELEDANRYKSQFLANVSHELRTPLNSIILLSKMLTINDGGRLNSDDVKKASVIFESGNELLRLINDILDLSKAESGAVSIHISKFSTKEIVTHLKDIFAHQALEKHLSFEIIDEYDDYLVSDKDKLLQIFRNIVSNSIKFTKSGGVKIKFTKDSGDLKILISDSGIGIPKDKIDIAFEPFQQVDGSISREFGGTGLGLSIVKEFANKLGIDIKVDSEPNIGTTFELVIPKNPTNVSMNENIESLKLDKKIVDNKPFVLLITNNKILSKKVVSINSNYNYNTAIYSELNEVKEFIKSGAIPLLIAVDTINYDIDFSNILQEIKTVKELQNRPLYAISKESDIIYNDLSLKGYVEFIKDRLLKSQKTIGSLPKLPTELSEIVIDNGFILKEFDSYLELEESLKSGCIDKIIMSDIDMIYSKNSAIREICKNIEIIGLFENSLSESVENSLKEYVEATIIQSPKALNRLIDELKRDKKSKNDILSAKNSLVSDISLEGKTILITDDDVKNIYVLSSVLESKGAKIIQAFDGAKAIEKLKQNKVDLILMDIMMPNMNGYEAISEIKSMEKFKDIPIIAITAKALKEDKMKCLEVGANDYLSKPVDYNVLISLIDAWLKKHNS